MTLSKVEAIEAEVDAETDDTIEVPLCDTTVRVLPAGEWRSSAVRALRSGDYDSWAEECLAGDDYADVWQPLDPVLNEVEAFFEAWKDATGQDAGKSRASRRSSKTKRKR
jgi:hypothetical protein